MVDICDKKSKTFAFKRVRFDAIEDHLRLGWYAEPPNGGHYQHLYGIIMLWICNCPIPGERISHASAPHN